VGTLAWLQQQNCAVSAAVSDKLKSYEQRGISCVLLFVDQQLAGLIGLEDSLRDDAVETIDFLLAKQLKVTVLSGDKKHVVEAITAPLGDIQRVAEVLPEDKSAVIRQLQQQGDVVAMVGDGINDSPALIQADVGIALASGTDVSIESADIVLSHNELIKVVQAKQLSTRTLRTIKQNIAISITYNIIMVPLAMMAYVSPLVAAITMPISSLLVILNAARIGRMFRR
jgi:Cu2+-exporting ATPase